MTESEGFLVAIMTICAVISPVPGLSEIDERTLTGQMEQGGVYIITENPAAATSAITVEVGAGHLDNPSGVPGLAHLLEHLVFAASGRDSPGGRLRDFIRDHAVAWNGRTTLETTLFTLEVPHDQLGTATGILLDAIYSPTLVESDIDREIDRIHDEYSDALNRPGYRLEYLAKAALGEDHAFGRREIGSRETLAIDGIAAHAEAFHRRHYRPENMGIGIVSKLAAEDVESILDSAVEPFRGRLPARPPSSASAPETGLSCSPVASSDVVAYEDAGYEQSDAIVRFYIPSEGESTRAAVEYIASLLDFKGDGSLHQFVVTNDIAHFSDAWVPSTTGECLVLEFTLRLRNVRTDRDGLRAMHSALAAWVYTIKAAAKAQWRIDEWLLTRRNSKAGEQPAVFERSVQLAGRANGQRSDMAHHQPGALRVIKPSSLPAILDRIDLASSLFLWPADLDEGGGAAVEPVTKIRFERWPAPERIVSAAEVKRLRARFEPPSRNEFLADVVAPDADREAAHPEASSRIPEARVFRVLVPKSLQSLIELQVSSTACRGPASCAVAAQLLRNILSSSARIDFAHASRAGFDIDFDSEDARLFVTVRGPTERHDVVLQRILSRMQKLDPTGEEIRQAAEALQSRIRRFGSQDPVNQLDYAATVEAGSRRWHVHELEQALDERPASKLKKIVERFLQALQFDIVYVGANSERIEQFGQLAEVGKTSLDREVSYCTRIQPWEGHEKRILRDTGESSPNAAVTVLLGQEPGSDADAAFMLLEKLVSPIYFETLRGRAYWVGTRFVQNGPYSGIHFRAQSTNSTSGDLLKANEKFLDELPSMIKALDESKIKQASTEVVQQMEKAQMDPEAAYDLSGCVSVTAGTTPTRGIAACSDGSPMPGRLTWSRSCRG